MPETPGTNFSSPARKAKKQVNYAESDDDEDDEPFKPLSGNGRAAKRRRISVKDEDSEDEFGLDAATQAAMVESDEGTSPLSMPHCATYQKLSVAATSFTSTDPLMFPSSRADAKTDMDDFVVDDDLDEDAPPQKSRKRPTAKTSKKETANLAVRSASPPQEEYEEIPASGSTAQQWTFDPDAPPSSEPRKPRPESKSTSSGPLKKPKAHTQEPDKRHTWLANVLDADKHPPDHPDYDPRTLYIPPFAFGKLSPFEQQYWGIKQKFMDTIVFFKKGKFYSTLR